MERHDVVVIGSGFGGAIPALRLGEAGRDVLVLERGGRKGAKEFRQTWDQTYTAMTRSWMLLVSSLAVTVLACQAEEASTADAGPSPTLGPCLSCHPLSSLVTPRLTEGEGPREWLAMAGRGLVLATPFVGSERLVLEWPLRGRHDVATLAACERCHATAPDGTGHGRAWYPADPATPSSIADCGGCHEWLPQAGRSRGFAGANGTVAGYEGSLQPADLLADTKDKHAAIFRDGFSATAERAALLYVRRLEPGCLGCHALSTSRHGEVPTCTDCHLWGAHDAEGTLAVAHTTIIASYRAAFDPGHVGEPDCIYCHETDGASDETYRASCYNCHLSGHNTRAVFWPMSER